MKRLTLLTAAALAAACSQASSPSQDGPTVTPVYSKETGRLEELTSDRDGDGKIDTRAFMDGARVVRVEIDRDGDGRTDRWEYYAAGGDAGAPTIERADEAGASDGRITRRMFYEDGLLRRVEEDTDGDDRVDKWEHYTRGVLDHVDLDLAGRGAPTQRLVYGAGGNVDRVESDPDGDGTFVAVRPGPAQAKPATP